MAVLQKGRSNYPFWGASITLITGLDPLSLQTTSEATYATLLPGISNLTNRLRYYGFYCWLLDFYFKKEKKGNSVEQYRFIRRAELMIAIVMQSERSDVLQITGSTFASTMINTNTGNYYDLAAGADKDDLNNPVYWKYPSGAFGQYYYGAMRAMSLVLAATNADGDAIYALTQPTPQQKVSGAELATAFDATLNNDVRNLFYNNVKKGRLKVADITLLSQYFAIDKVDAELPQWKLYRNMLLDKDEPALEMEEHFTYHRKESIMALINTAQGNGNNYDWQLFLLQAYELKMGTKEYPVAETMIGWYTYQFNEYYQYACGAIFWAVLQHLYSFQQDQYLPAFIKNLGKTVTKKICKRIPEATPATPVAQILQGMHVGDDEPTLTQSIESRPTSDPIEAATNGFLLLFRLYNENSRYLHPLKDFMTRKEMIREGNMVDGLLSVHAAKGDELENFIQLFLLQKIVYRHQKVAIRKMGNGSQSTHKFIIEEQYIRFIDTFPPRFTSPRMNALWNLLFDLGVVDEDGMLTSLHEQLLIN